MMKRKRKSRNTASNNNGQQHLSLYYTTTDGNIGGGDELDDCMAEFDAAMMDDDCIADDAAGSPQRSQDISRDKDEACRHQTTAIKAAASSTLKNAKSNQHHILLEEDDALRQLWNPNVAPPPYFNKMVRGRGAAPNLKLEIIRNSQTSKLSSYLLTTVANALKIDPNSNDGASVDHNHNHNPKQKQKLKQLRMPAFERWLLDSKLEERFAAEDGNNNNNSSSAYSDPVLPMNPTCALLDDDTHAAASSSTDVATKRLLAEMVEVGVPLKRARQIGHELCALCKRAVKYIRELATQSRRSQTQTQSSKKSKTVMHHRIELVKKKKKKKMDRDADRSETQTDGDDDCCMYTLLLHRKKQNPFVCKITALHYRKLHQMYTANCSTACISSTSNTKNDIASFHVYLMAILIRYSTLSGGQQLKDLRGGGMQGAIHAQVFDFLYKVADCRMECFASPMNAYYCSFFSAFGQLDGAFGGRGDFFALNVNANENASLEGCFECNPPFAPGLMSKMVHRLDQHLAAAKKQKRKLTFIVVVPSVSDKKGDNNFKSTAVQTHAEKSFRAMLRSRFKKHHVVLRSREHGYVEGSQHLRPTRFKESQYDTSVVVLSSCCDVDDHNLSWCKLEDLDEFDKGIEAAFSSRHLLELEQRRMSGNAAPALDDCDGEVSNDHGAGFSSVGITRAYSDNVVPDDSTTVKAARKLKCKKEHKKKKIRNEKNS